jgi:response regulator RpfG family c-di-GMP phosphodiesterase
VERALDLIKTESGRHFDPQCVDALLENLEKILASRAPGTHHLRPKAG